MNPNTNLYLYAKGHYQRNNLIKDLQAIIGDMCAIKPEYVDTWGIITILCSAVQPHLVNADLSRTLLSLLRRASPGGAWKTGQDGGSYEVRVMGALLTILQLAKVRGLDLGEPDPNILELKEVKPA